MTAGWAATYGGANHEGANSTQQRDERYVPASATPEENTRLFEKLFNEAAERVKSATVKVKAVRVMKREEPEKSDRREHHFGQEFFDRHPGTKWPREFRQQSCSSGLIIDSTGHILTTDTTIKDAHEICVTLNDRREFQAKIIGRDPPTNLAVIKIETEDLPVATLGDSDQVRMGYWVMAIGYPSSLGLMDLDPVVIASIVSATGLCRLGVADYEDFILVNNTIPGIEGGPLVNLQGEVVGITWGGYQGLGLAIPINIAKIVMESLIERGKVTRGWLGLAVQDITKELAKNFNLPTSQGVVISDISPNSPAERAGLQRGEIILELDGRKIRDIGHLRNIVAHTPVGKTVRLKTLRGGDLVELQVAIGGQSADPLDGGTP